MESFFRDLLSNARAGWSLAAFLLFVLVLAMLQPYEPVRWVLAGLGKTIFSNAFANVAYLLLAIGFLSPGFRKNAWRAIEPVFRKISLGGIGLELPSGPAYRSNDGQSQVSRNDEVGSGFKRPDGGISYGRLRDHYEYYRTYSLSVLEEKANGKEEAGKLFKEVSTKIEKLKGSQASLYQFNKYVFVGHRLVATKTIGGTRFHDVEIFLRDCERNKSRRVKKVEYYLGEGWDGQLFISRNPSTRFGIRVSAWGEFIVVARIHYWPEDEGGYSETVETWRYVDFFGNPATSDVVTDRTGAEAGRA